MPLILGLDPGSRHTGYGLIRAGDRRAALVASGRLSPSPAWALPRRLLHLHEGLMKIMSEWPPEAVAVETLFTGRNIRSAVVLAQARGVLLLAAAQAGAEIFEYAPREVKNAVTGYGQAGKDQVAFMVGRLLDYHEPLAPDAADALAAALCHAHAGHTAHAGRADWARPGRGRGGWRGLSEEDLAALGRNRSRAC